MSKESKYCAGQPEIIARFLLVKSRGEKVKAIISVFNTKAELGVILLA
jgi:hypothetical protein